MTTEFRIQTANASHIDVITDFNCRLALETEDRVLNRETVREGVRRGLELQPEVQYFLVLAAEAVVGQIMVTREWSDWRNGWIWWLQSLYVPADFRRQGIFRLLLNHVKSAALAQSAACIRLYVERDNKSAIEAYHRQKFRDAGYQVMELAVADF